MRNFINIVEAKKKYVAPAINQHPSELMRSGLSVEQAKEMLDENPHGILVHDIFEKDAFITKTQNGDYVFFNPIEFSIEVWDWVNDISALAEISHDSYDDPFEKWTYAAITPKNDFLFVADIWDEIWSGRHVAPYSLRPIAG